MIQTSIGFSSERKARRQNDSIEDTVMTEKIKELFSVAEQARSKWEEWLITDRQYAERLSEILGKINAELNKGTGVK